MHLQAVLPPPFRPPAYMLAPRAANKITQIRQNVISPQHNRCHIRLAPSCRQGIIVQQAHLIETVNMPFTKRSVSLAVLFLASCRADGALVESDTSTTDAPHSAAAAQTPSQMADPIIEPDADGGPSSDANSALTISSLAAVAPKTFAQGLFRGQDPRVSQRAGYYYYVGWVGQVLEMFKSKSLVDQGVGKPLPAAMGSPLFAPVYIDQVRGVTYNAWYIFGGTSVWSCNCADPYDNIDQWKVVAQNLPFNGNPFDVEIFKNPQPGPYQNHWYMTFVASETGGYAEDIYVAELLSLTPNTTILSNYNTQPANATNKVAGWGGWTDIIVEAPGTAINGNTVSLAYSGQGTQTSLYALGLLLLKQGADPSVGANWLDYSRGGCDGSVHNAPEFAKNANVLGPGVARFVKSADGKEDWMVYHAKTFDTWDRTLSTPEAQQYHREEYSRYVALQKFGWKNVTCSANVYSIPDFGTPQGQGTVMTLPSGDVGVQAKSTAFKIEAEAMIPYGDVMGQAVQSLATTNTVVLTRVLTAASNQSKTVNFKQLANGQITGNKTSGIIWRNSPPGTRLTISHGNPLASNIDLFINGTLHGTLSLPSTGNYDVAVESTYSVTIPSGAEIRLQYTTGRTLNAADFDYVKIAP